MIRAAALALLLSGCAIPSPMGGFVYCPQGHVCESAMAPAQPASAPRRVQWERTL
jgi:hypothetical protein